MKTKKPDPKKLEGAARHVERWYRAEREKLGQEHLRSISGRSEP